MANSPYTKTYTAYDAAGGNKTFDTVDFNKYVHIVFYARAVGMNAGDGEIKIQGSIDGTNYYDIIQPDGTELKLLIDSGTSNLTLIVTEKPARYFRQVFIANSVTVGTLTLTTHAINI